MRISDWSSDVCSSDLDQLVVAAFDRFLRIAAAHHVAQLLVRLAVFTGQRARRAIFADQAFPELLGAQAVLAFARAHERRGLDTGNQHVLLARSEEHTSELQSLMRLSHAVFCLKKK